MSVPPHSDPAGPAGPGPGTPDREARKWAMICHLIALIGLAANGIGFVVGPLVVWLLKRDDHPFIDQAGKEALNFQITMFIALAVGALLTLVLVGIPILVIVGLLMIIMPIIAGIKADAGVPYRYPFSIRLVK